MAHRARRFKPVRIDRTVRKKPDAGRGDFDENDENDDLFRSSERQSPFDYFSGMPDKTDSTVGVEQADDKGHVEQLKLHVREAPLVSDPFDIEEWTDSRLRKIFAYWVSMIVLACILNAIVIYAFRILPKLYTTTELRAIFLAPPYLFTSIVGSTVVIMLTSFYALYVLVYPDETEWRLGNLRWLGFVILIGYLIFCLFFYIWDSTQLLGKLRSMMVEDVKRNNGSSILETTSQRYFHCCGIDGPKDWEKIGKRNVPDSGYPQSCCNKKDYPLCAEPIQDQIRIITNENTRTIKDIDAIYTNGCFFPEALLTCVVVGLFTAFCAIFVATSIPCCVYMNNLLINVDIRHINLERANPFYD